MQKTKGFTLIELLVVIAIIGILSGLIIVSMSGAQNAAKDARIKSAMDQFRSTTEIYKLNTATGIYGVTSYTVSATPCVASGTLLAANSDGLALCTDIQSQASSTAIYVYSTNTAWCMSKALTSGSLWCLDSTGYVGAPTAATTCSTTTKCI